MNLNKLLNVVVVLTLVLLPGTVAFSQYSSEIWMTVKDDAGPSDFMKMRFGNYNGATYGIDSLNFTLVEKEGPPLSPGFDCRWATIPGRTPANLYGAGLLYYNFRETDGQPTRKDTFVILFQNPDNPTANFTLKWPDAGYLALRCDSMFIVDPTSQLVPVRLNMFTVDSLYLVGPGALDLPITKLRIYKYGAKIIDDVKKESQVVPSSFALHQNYPNPFNPTTTVMFDVQKRSMTDVSVYNLLGQKVTTLVARDLAPGTYSTVWNGLNDQGRAVTSGVYFVRMVTRTGDTEQFSALRKMLLMK
jgi:hypothetical protein